MTNDMNRLSQYVNNEIWDVVPVIHEVFLSSRGFVVEYGWNRNSSQITHEIITRLEGGDINFPVFWSRTLYKSGTTYLRRGEFPHKIKKSS